jgi:tRNA-dihydrouridine synthase 3
LKQKRNQEFALIRRHADEPCFGVQLASLKPDEAAWAAALVASRGADFIDLNVGCPIDYFTRKGLGASIGRHPNRLRRLVEAMARAAAPVPITAKIRLGWSDDDRNYLDQARAAIDGGAVALAVHGRTRNARYRLDADWRAIAEIVSAASVPVIGNGDVLFPHEIDRARRASGCAAVMVARGALIKPWIFREAAPTSTAWRAYARSSHGISISGAATCRNCRMAPIRRCSSAPARGSRARRSRRCWHGGTRQRLRISLSASRPTCRSIPAPRAMRR